ncbi:MAG: hypothetical protein RIB03_06900 [Henriciella sp.]|uniref:hypothetical protein n=1 Tax=Henriciella sp. TaxID=1968823 RepID=UPI00262D6F8F|nr:hypothetical protein [Henriciella sp.]
MIRLVAVLFALSTLAACGFRPLYAGQGGSGAVSGQNISVEEIPGRSGYNLRQSLIRDLSIGVPGLEESTVLSVSLKEDIARATLLPDGAVSRSFYNATGRYTLATADGAISGSASVQVPFAASQTPYTDVSAQTYAAERAMTELSRRITEQIRIQVQTQK